MLGIVSMEPEQRSEMGRNKGACTQLDRYALETRALFLLLPSFLPSFLPRGNLVREKSRHLLPLCVSFNGHPLSSLRKRTSLVTSYRSSWNDVDYERTEVGRGFQWEIDDREDGGILGEMVQSDDC